MAGAVKKTASPASAPAPIEELSAPNVEKVAEAVSAPATEMHATVRKAVEKGVADTRAAFANAKTAAEEATGAFEASYSTAAKGVVAFNAKAFEALRVNTEANFDFIKSAIGAKSVSEFVALQGEHARKQAQTFGAQAKEIAALAQKVATDSVEPIKSQVAKTLKLAV
jgi:phasin